MRALGDGIFFLPWHFLIGMGRCKEGARKTELTGLGAVLGRVSAALDRENAPCRGSEADDTFSCHSETQPCCNM